MAEITLGDVVRCSATFTVNGVDTDPTTVVFKYENDDLVAWTYGVDAEVVKDATGKYHVDITTETLGAYAIKWEGMGAVRAMSESSFPVASQ